MSSYRIDELSVDQLDRISLPKFQRGFVWTKKKQEDFVQTLHDGLLSDLYLSRFICQSFDLSTGAESAVPVGDFGLFS